MKKLLLLSLLLLTGCIADEQLPQGAEYLSKTTELFESTGAWSGVEYDNSAFICFFGYIFDRDASGSPIGNRLTDGIGAEITCDPFLFYRTIVTKV